MQPRSGDAFAAVAEFVAREGTAGMQVVGVQPRPGHAPPRPLDDRPHAGGGAPGQRRFPQAAKPPCVRAQVGGDIHRDEGIARGLLWRGV
jgi:hypothetical protein